MSAMKRLTLDALILGMLSDHPSVTAKEVSDTWGEDKARCDGWLEKFRKAGLCTVSRDGPSGTAYYTSRPLRIAEYTKLLNPVKGFTVPGSKERRVLFVEIRAHVARNPAYTFVLAKIVTNGPA
jgi:hypothetical protein